MTSLVWDGLVASNFFREPEIKLRHELADAAKSQSWVRVLEILRENLRLVNVTRPDGKALYAPLHQAAHGGAGVEVVEALLEMGAWRCLRTSEGKRPVDIAAGLGRTHLLGVLQPAEVRQVPAEALATVQRTFHELIRWRAGHLPTFPGLRLPELEVLLEFPPMSRCGFSIPGMYGGFSFELVRDGEDPMLVTESWCRVAGGSGQRHEITVTGATLVEEGFV